jgi:ankyrin repeat protein
MKGWLQRALGAEEEKVETTQESTIKPVSLAVIRAKIAGKIKRKENITSKDLEALTSSGANSFAPPVNKLNGFTLLHLAVVHNHIQAIRIIMERSASEPPYGLFPNQAYGTALHLAANSNKPDAIKVIIELAQTAISRRHPDFTREKVKKTIGLTYDSNNNVPFMSAVLSGHREAMNSMIPLHIAYYAYTAVNNGVKEYHSAFKAAAQSLNPQEFYELFVQYRNLNTKDFLGNTCLDYALEFQNIEAINYLANHQQMKNLNNFKALVATKSELERSGENPEFQTAVAKAIAQLQQTELTELVDGPELYLEAPVEFTVENNEFMAQATDSTAHEELKFPSQKSSDLDRSNEEDSTQDPEQNAPRSRAIIADIIDENRESNIARRREERETAFITGWLQTQMLQILLMKEGELRYKIL